MRRWKTDSWSPKSCTTCWFAYCRSKASVPFRRMGRPVRARAAACWKTCSTSVTPPARWRQRHGWLSLPAAGIVRRSPEQPVAPTGRVAHCERANGSGCGLRPHPGPGGSAGGLFRSPGYCPGRREIRQCALFSPCERLARRECHPCPLQSGVLPDPSK
jgi:hypothetical protein